MQSGRRESQRIGGITFGSNITKKITKGVLFTEGKLNGGIYLFMNFLDTWTSIGGI